MKHETTVASDALQGPKVVVVGELNPFGVDPRLALYHLPRTSSGNRLRLIMGLSDVDYAKLAKVNLCAGKWSVREARERAKSLVVEAAQATVFVLLGKRVTAAFGVLYYWGVSQCDGERLRFLSLPHPSGLCREWNKPGAAERARHLLRLVAPQWPWGSADSVERGEGGD